MGFFKAVAVDATVSQAKPTADDRLFILKMTGSRIMCTEVELESLKLGVTSTYTYMHSYEGFIESRIS